MNNKDFSIIILNNNESELLNCLKSIENQDYDLNKLEVIIETLKISENILRDIKKLKLECIIREQKKLNISTCYNDAIKISSGKYIQFSNSNISFEQKKSLKMIIDKCNVNDIICLNMSYYDVSTNKKVNYNFSNKNNINIDLEKTSGEINLSLESYFISKNLCKKINFEHTFNSETKIKFLVELYQLKPLYYNFSQVKLLSQVPLDDNKIESVTHYEKDWYTESLNNWINYIKNMKRIPIYIQEIIMYVIFSKYNANINDKNKNVLNEAELTEFFEKTKELLSYLDNKTILQNGIDSESKKIKHKFIISKSLKLYFYKIKNENNVYTYTSNKRLYAKKENNITQILNFESEKINVYAINYNKGKLIFDCSIGVKDYLNDEDINLQIKYGKNEINYKKIEIYNQQQVFGKIFNEKYMIQFELDIKNNLNDLKVFLLYNNNKYQLNFNFVKVQSRLSNSKRSYWNYMNITIENKKDKLSITKYSLLKTVKLELLFILSKLKNEKNKIRVVKLILLRLLYFITKPYFKRKNIWVTFDKLYKAGDNGEYIYQYALKNKKNIYYIINKESNDYKRLIKQDRKHILIHNSLREKLYCLHAKAILKTHANILGFCGFDGMEQKFICGIFNAEVIEIQHGLTIQDIPIYQNRLVDNLKLYLIASNFEAKNVLQPIYGFDEERVKLTGISRYDGLVNNDKKIVLITPTWRHAIAAPSTKHGVPRGYNNAFKKSEYYKIYNELINNKKLINEAKKYNYKIVYLIHPTLSGQIDDFDKNDFVEIIPATGEISYEKILTEASIMVTDYSGVQYDFAYMRKPIIYFHPDELPPHYDVGSINYEKEGFGIITKNITDTVEELCKNIRNGCSNSSKYIKRANNFFAFDDYKSCERIYAEIENYIKEHLNEK